MRKLNGFTLIELLIVISIIGVLAGVSLSLINAPRQKAIAQDGVNTSTLEKLASGLEAYNAAEGSYPVDANSDGNPMNDSNTSISSYLVSWPAGYVYSSPTILNTRYMCVSVPMATDGTKYFKFVDSFPAVSNSCVTKIVKNCPAACGTTSSSVNIGNCVTLDDLACN